MKFYPRLFAKLFCSPLLLHEPVRLSFERTLLGKMDLVPVSPADEDEEPEPQQPEDYRVARIYQPIGNIALISISGVIDKQISNWDMMCYGGCDLDDVDRALALAKSDDAIEKVILYVNSPGGSAIGVPETGARIADLRASKEVRARVDLMACSAGYWLASQCDRIDATQSAILGSIGVYTAVLDATRAMEILGYKMQLIKAGKYKAMGAPFKELTKDEIKLIQAQTDDIYEEFTGAVVEGRDAAGCDIDEETMQGQSFRGRRAIELGLCDELVTATLDEYVTHQLVG
ncbi:MAG TPA: S49 family peptidase [Chthoniobacterales bacterium]|jgi:protease-4|nr:S49 family peptidase [Chthoniobacterales bacterium]